MATKPITVERAKIAVQNVNVPGHVVRVDAVKYDAMKIALLKVLPKYPGGMTQAEMRKAVVEYLPHREFPGGKKAGWWAKCVQLDLEAKGIIQRDTSEKPLKWFRVN